MVLRVVSSFESSDEHEGHSDYPSSLGGEFGEVTVVVDV